jgi:tripartite-type tricarboxylate transporter receptor subunit TctC
MPIRTVSARPTRRRLLQGAIAAAALLRPWRRAAAAVYPGRPVRVIVPFAPGGPVDVFGRLLADKLSTRLGQQFFIENHGGAGGNIGTGRAAKAAPDGYTLLLNANNHVINPLLYATVPYDPLKDFVPISLAVTFPTAVMVKPSLNLHSVADLVAFVRANPKKYGFASAGVGTPSHLLAERMRQKLALDLVHVPYNGSAPTAQAVMAGDTPIGFAGLTAAAPLAKAGRLTIVAIMSKRRAHGMPDVPSIAEAGYPELAGEAWDAMFAPTGTPPAIVTRLADEIGQIVRLPDVAARLETLGLTPIGMPTDAFARQLVAESAVWADVIRAAGLKLK